MSAQIILQDGRAWFAANWAFRAAIREIASSLKSVEEENLGNWFSDQLQVDLLLSYGLDLRGLTEQNQKAFSTAVKTAVQICKEKGSVDWSDPRFFPDWLKHFERLEQMILAVEQKLPPVPELNDIVGIIDRPPRKIGPGWK